jgi:hypothetical protein
MGYTITHSLANGLTANLSVSRPGVYAVYDPGGKFITYAPSLKAAKEFAQAFVVPVNSGL